MRTRPYPGDLTDAPGALIGPHLPASPGGRPRAIDPREGRVVDAIPHLLRTGCQWRHPPLDFPQGTAWRYLDRGRPDGPLDTIPDRLRRAARAPEKPYRPRASAGVDGQSVDAPSGGERRGRAAVKDGAGRKRHVVVGGVGPPPAVVVTAGGGDDARAAAELLARPAGQVVRMAADGAGHDLAPSEWVGANARWRPSLARRPEGREGWVRRPIRGTVERPFARLGRGRRSSQDRGEGVRSSEAFIKLALIHPRLNRLEPSGTDAAVRSRKVA